MSIASTDGTERHGKHVRPVQEPTLADADLSLARVKMGVADVSVESTEAPLERGPDVGGKLKMANSADRRRIRPPPDKFPPLTAAAATTLVDETISALEEWRRLVVRGPLDLARNSRVGPAVDRTTEAVNAVVAAAPRMRDRNGRPLETRKQIYHGSERKGEVVASCGTHPQLALCLFKVRVASDRFELLMNLERAIEAARELRTDVAPQNPPAEVQELKLDEARRVVTYGGRGYPFGSTRAFDVFRAIARGRGAWVTGGALGPRPDKVWRRIPSELRALIVAKRGAGGGYRLRSDRATVP